MTLLLTIVTALPIGFLIRNRTVAYLSYIAALQFLFTFQTAQLVLEWAGGNEAAFGGPFPEHSFESALGYGIVNLVIFATGLGLVTLGARLRHRRLVKTTHVELAH